VTYKILFLLLTVLCPLALAESFHTQMVLNTFKITNSKSNGSVFILTRPAPDDPAATQTILVTAKHVLEKMEADTATVILRKKKDDGLYEKVPMKLNLRREGKALWTQHPTEDVAVMIVTLPPEVERPNLSIDLLAKDETLRTQDIHPGTSIFCSGFPHAGQFDPGDAGFPVIRTGCIASFPLIPTSKTKTFLADFNTFEGDSGGAIFIAGADEKKTRLIVGLVHGQHFIEEKYKNIYQSGEVKHRLGLGIIVHASAIRSAIELLPAK